MADKELTFQEGMKELKEISPSLYQEVQEAFANVNTISCVICGSIMIQVKTINGLDNDTCSACAIIGDDATDWLE